MARAVLRCRAWACTARKRLAPSIARACLRCRACKVPCSISKRIGCPAPSAYFWATWCRPCVKELPYFEFVNETYSKKNVKVLLVSLDFPSQVESKIKPYIFTKKIKSKLLLLDDPDLKTWIPKVSDKWGGGIPATLIVNRSNYNFYPNPFDQESLVNEINRVLD